MTKLDACCEVLYTGGTGNGQVIYIVADDWDIVHGLTEGEQSSLSVIMVVHQALRKFCTRSSEKHC